MKTISDLQLRNMNENEVLHLMSLGLYQFTPMQSAYISELLTNVVDDNEEVENLRERVNELEEDKGDWQDAYDAVIDRMYNDILEHDKYYERPEVEDYLYKVN